MEKRYQVFISSTFSDLQDERRAIMQAVMELDCIPAGMELFPASDESQWDFIKKVIEDCDYYLVLVGGRYGSLTEEGISFTEKEYDYAVSKGLRVIAFIHQDPDSLPVKKSDTDPQLKERLDLFRQKLSTNRLVKHWKESKELTALVTSSLVQATKRYPAVGWVRSTSIITPEIAAELNALRAENAKLKELLNQVESKNTSSIADLSKGNEVVEGDIRWITSGRREKRRIGATWDEILKYIGPDLFMGRWEHYVSSSLARGLATANNITAKDPSLDESFFQQVKIQLYALGYVSIYVPVGNTGQAWILTEMGKRTLVEVMAKRTEKQKTLSAALV